MRHLLAFALILVLANCGGNRGQADLPELTADVALGEVADSGGLQLRGDDKPSTAQNTPQVTGTQLAGAAPPQAPPGAQALDGNPSDGPDSPLPSGYADDLLNPDAPASPNSNRQRRGLAGLFGRRAPKEDDIVPGGAVTEVRVNRGQEVQFGTVGRICGLKKSDMGTQVDEALATKRGYELYDTIPNSTAQRTHYINGFSDRCARQVTGAFVIFGEPALHETWRYKPGNTEPYSEVDRVYETVKGRICGVREGVPCPTDRVERLERRLVFATVYASFGGTSRLEILLDNGKIVAQTRKP